MLYERGTVEDVQDCHDSGVLPCMLTLQTPTEQDDLHINMPEQKVLPLFEKMKEQVGHDFAFGKAP